MGKPIAGPPLVGYDLFGFRAYIYAPEPLLFCPTSPPLSLSLTLPLMCSVSLLGSGYFIISFTAAIICRA